MKVCLLTRRANLETGGIGRVTLELQKHLEQLGHETLIVQTDKESLSSYFKYAFHGIKKQIPKDFDIYHAITPMESIWIPKEKSIATILDIIPLTDADKHGARMGSSRIKQFIGRQCFKIGCRQAAKCSQVAFISEFVRGEFKKKYDIEDKDSVIRLGINKNLTPQPKRERTFRIGYLGQLDRRKRVHLLIEAFTNSRLDGELILGGSGTDPKYVEYLKDLAYSDNRIRFLGYIQDDALSEFYRTLDLMIFPTAAEGYGLPIVEAMACKKPVMVLRDSIIPPDVKYRCLIVDDLKETLRNWYFLEELITDYSNTEWNYRFAKSHDWSNCVKSYIELYEKILT